MRLSIRTLFIAVLILSACHSACAQYIGGEEYDLRVDPEFFPLAWKNNNEQIILQDDSTCRFQMDRAKHTERHPVDGGDFGSSPYYYKTDEKGTYSFSGDTLIISFDNGRANDYYLIKNQTLVFLKDISSKRTSERKSKLRTHKKFTLSHRPDLGCTSRAYSNNSDRIILLNDTSCLFQQNRFELKANHKKYRDKDGVTHMPRAAFYVYDIQRRAWCTITGDTLTITFIRIPSDRSQDRCNRYLLKTDGLYFFPELCSSPFVHRKMKLGRIRMPCYSVASAKQALGR